MTSMAVPYNDHIKGSEKRKCCVCEWWDGREAGKERFGTYFKGKYYCPTHAKEIVEPIDTAKEEKRMFIKKLKQRMKKWTRRLTLK